MAVDGILEWLTLRAAVRRTRAAVAGRGAGPRELQRRARLACELAERVFEPIDPLRNGSGAPYAAELYRQSVYWSLRTLTSQVAAPSAAELWRASSAVLEWAVPDPDARERLRWLFVEATPVDLAERPDAEQRELAQRARALAHAALEAAEGPELELDRLRFTRALRLTTVALVALLLAGSSAWIVVTTTRRPDLAAGKRWRASSSWADCEPAARRCGPLRTDILFHTKEDANPWVEFDLGKPTRFSAVVVDNRTDDAPDRAIPLVIEIGNDQKKWRALARRKQSFRTWTAEFKPQTARYVRLRVDRRSYLHLERVKIHP